MNLHKLRLVLGGRLSSVVTLIVASALTGFCEAAILAIIAEAAGALVNGSHHVHASFGPLSLNVALGTLLFVGFVLALVRTALQIPMSLLPARISADVQARLQRELFAAFMAASWSEQARDREGHLQELMTNQISQGTSAAVSASALISALLTLIILIASALVVNPTAAVAVLVIAVVLFGILRPLNRLIQRWAHHLSGAQISYASGVGQATRLAQEIQVFGVGQAQTRALNMLIATARRFYFRVQLLGRIVPNVYQSAIYMLVIGMLSVLLATHQGHVASLGAVVLLLIRAGSYMQTLQGAYQGLRQAMPFIDRVQDTTRRYAESAPPAGTRGLQRIDRLAFEHVGFEYVSGRPVLEDLNFSVDAGEAIGIVGPSGAGKSTLMQLLLLLREPTSGRYLVNGVPAGEIRRADWNAQVSYVPQEPRLIHASVADNIRYFRDLSDPEIERAAQLARIDHDIADWADGYETVIGPRADAISGGQQQRICIARALAGRPTVLVLDEPTSALDPGSESLLQESLVALKDELTLFVIAHRMSTLDICDRVMVILDGRLNGFDTAASLRAHNGYYRAALAFAAGSDAS
ncbi:MAG: ABC transporter ATP-binding protein [Solirubrobacteraceae bacterium]|jgi:ABC-type multidrug transport system fused ATPase/permease subunit